MRINDIYEALPAFTKKKFWNWEGLKISWNYYKKKKGGEEERSSFIKKSFEIERFTNIEKLLRKKRKWEKNDINEALSKRKSFEILVFQTLLKQEKERGEEQKRIGWSHWKQKLADQIPNLRSSINKIQKQRNRFSELTNRKIGY